MDIVMALASIFDETLVPSVARQIVEEAATKFAVVGGQVLLASAVMPGLAKLAARRRIWGRGLRFKSLVDAGRDLLRRVLGGATRSGRDVRPKRSKRQR